MILSYTTMCKNGPNPKKALKLHSFELCNKKQVIEVEDLFLSQIFDRFSTEIQHFLQLLEHNMANGGPPTVHILV